MEHRWFIPNPYDYIVGYYMGTIDNPYGISDYKPSKLHVVHHMDGDFCYRFFGTYMLDKMLQEIDRGELISLMYKGKKTLKNGRQMHDYKLTRRGDIDDS